MADGSRRVFSPLLGLLCFGLTAWVCWYYPLPVWPLAAVLVAYAAALWRWPVLFLIVVPATLPAFDLGIWTGWTMLGEPDLIVLVSIGALLFRVPLSRSDLFPGGRAGSILLFLVAAFEISAIIGLLTVTGDSAVSDNPYLRPDNALRLTKPLAEALLLLPFIRQRQRLHGDASTWLGWGMVAGLTAVAAEVIAERAAFPGIFDFTSDYRVTAAFYSMHIGGGHIGAYITLAMPFLPGCALAVRGWCARLISLALAPVAAYALVVTFARTSYAACAASLLVALIAWLILRPRGGGQQAGRLMAMALIVPIVGGLLLGASSGYMRDRFGQSTADLLTRELNWRNGWALHDGDAWHVAFGMGLGTYARLNREMAAGDRPGDFHLVGSGENRYLSVSTTSPLYIGQKLFFRPSGPLRLKFRWRASAGNALPGNTGVGVIICEKVLLYSDNCRGENIPSHAAGTWEAASVTIPTDGLGARKLLGLPVRPIELSLIGTPGATVALNGLSLTDDQGREILANGDFAAGMARWGFTSDDHLIWRMKNLYLMLLFETGLFGLLAFLALCAAAVLGGARALRRGDAMGGAVIAGVVAFLICGLFDNLLEAPRIATVFLLVCVTGLISLARQTQTQIQTQAQDSIAWPEPVVADTGPEPPEFGTPIGEIERY